MQNQNPIEKIFESFLWNTRLGTIIVVIFSALGSLGMFILGSMEIYHSLTQILAVQNHTSNTETILISIIGALDLYLIGIVLIIFSFGIYELFISKIDIDNRHEHLTILNITSLDELKNKILKVIIMVLIVSFSKTMLSLDFKTPIDMLCYAISILALASGVFLIRKKDHDE